MCNTKFVAIKKLGLYTSQTILENAFKNSIFSYAIDFHILWGMKTNCMIEHVVFRLTYSSTQISEEKTPLVASLLQSAIEGDESQRPLNPDITLNLNQLDTLVPNQ